jgi:hypothetical protein
MAVKRLSAETLIEVAIATLQSDVTPKLAGEQRYTMAMVVNALEIARRELVTDDDSRTWKMLDEIYDDGEGSTDTFAKDIRRGAVSTASRKDLHASLREMLVAELKIKNPRFLTSRGAA